MSYCRAWDPSHWSPSQDQWQFQWSEIEFENNNNNKQTNKNLKKWCYALGLLSFLFLGYWFISLWVSCVWAAIHPRIWTNKPSKEETQIQLASWSSTLQVGHQHAHSLYWFPLSKCQAFSGCTYIIMHPWFCSAVSQKKNHLVWVNTVKFASIKLFELPWIKNSYFLKWRWLVVVIYWKVNVHH